MKILTWNINGIRATKMPLGQIFNELDADIICLQETKMTRDLLDEPSAIVEGYNSYFSFCKTRSGYSGVATFVRDSVTPCKAEEGLSGLLTSDVTSDNIGCYGDQSEFSDEELHSLDNEGRTVITQHQILTHEGEEALLTVINVYCVRADPENEERKAFKLRFYELLQTRAEALLEKGSHVIVLGDVNTSHKPIDHCDPAEIKEFQKRPDRAWLNQFLVDPKSESEKDTSQKDRDSHNVSSESDQLVGRGHKFVDSFRYFHPDQRDAYTCWNTMTGARATNYGTRIDYILGDVKLVKEGGFEDCVVMQDVEGSDHCPVKATLTWEVLAAKKCPSFCSKFLPEFAGKQQKLSCYFTKGLKASNGPHNLKKNRSDGESISSCSQGSSDSISGSDPGNAHHSHTSSQPDSKGSLKRGSSDPNSNKSPVRKKLKPTEKKPSGGKQGNLLSFFGKGKAAAGRGDDVNHSFDKSSDSGQTLCKSTGSFQPKDFKESKSSDVTASQEASSGSTKNVEAATLWKSMLKGPPPAPLCNGHKEPCVLRTVLKDSLNKGRQFWVCCRPDGHKSNPQARCDHFVWVQKKNDPISTQVYIY